MTTTHETSRLPHVQHLPRHGLAEEEAIRKGIIPTRVSPAVARAMVWGFLVLIFCLPLVQAGIELASGQRPRVLRFLGLFEAKEQDLLLGYRARLPLPTQQELKDFEEADLADASLAKQTVQPRVQALLTALGGFGNVKGVLGRDGWLFYQPGIDAITGKGILDPGRVRAKTRKMIDGGASQWHADPRPAILQFQKDCAAAGVRLIVVPVPDKAGCQPARLSQRLAGYHGAALANPDHRRLMDQLRAAGVEVFDPTPADVEAERFLKQDTHWTPAWMEQVARDLAGVVELGGSGLSGPRRTWRVREVPVARVGDLVDMLKLPAHQHLYAPQTVTVHQVASESGELWQPEPAAEVVLLGDSFTNIYSMREMGWGQAAGFGAQLARYLGRDVDVIARNGSGASATRKELAKRPDPLAGKKVLIWEFASRDLFSESWDPVPMRAKGGASTAAPATQELVVRARLLDAPPRVPTNDVYDDALVVLKFQVEQVVRGRYEAKEVLAAMSAMRKRQLLAPATFKAGAVYRLTLLPKAPAEVASWKKLDDTGEFELTELWASEARPE